MSQNIYDRPDFFAAYAKAIDRSSAGRGGPGLDDNDPLWRRMRALLPASLAHTRVLDLGCGSGWFSRWAVDAGAASVTALDVSHNMISKARALSRTDTAADEERTAAYTARIDYRIVDLDDDDAVAAALDTPATTAAAADADHRYDVAFSSMALHYLAHADRLVARVRDRLRPGAVFVVAVEHPVYTAPPRSPRVVRDAEDAAERSWNLAGYYDEGERVVEWLDVRGVRKHHRTLETYLGFFDLARPAGFELVGLSEMVPTGEEIEAGRYGEEDLMRPLFLVMGLRRRE